MSNRASSEASFRNVTRPRKPRHAFLLRARVAGRSVIMLIATNFRRRLCVGWPSLFLSGNRLFRHFTDKAKNSVESRGRTSERAFFFFSNAENMIRVNNKYRLCMTHTHSGDNKQRRGMKGEGLPPIATSRRAATIIHNDRRS